MTEILPIRRKSLFNQLTPNEATIFTAETKETQLAFERIKISKDTHFTIFSESFLFTIST